MRIALLALLPALAIAKEYNAPEVCRHLCPPELGDVGQACANLTIEKDISAKAACHKICDPEFQNAMIDCYICCNKVDTAMASLYSYSTEQICGQAPPLAHDGNATDSNTTADSPIHFVNTTAVDNGSGMLFVPLVAVVFGLAAASVF